MNQPSPFWRWLAHKLEPYWAVSTVSSPNTTPAPPPMVTVTLQTGTIIHKPEGIEAPASDTLPTVEHLRELMGLALSMPTPDAIFSFIDFAHRMRKMGPYNVMMVFAQRPGATAVDSRETWAKFGQKVRPDAIPILILHPRGPIVQVFELLDTLPVQERDPRTDAFAATGEFGLERLMSVINGFGATKRLLRVDIVFADFGGDLAGKITAFGALLPPTANAALLGQANLTTSITTLGVARWRIKLNSRLTPAEQFATLMHELGHLCCGHLGGFYGETPDADEYGWPDRSDVPHAVKEIEAELVAWVMCDREGLTTGSPLYLRPYLEQTAPNELAKLNLDRVIRAVARIRMHIGDPKPRKAQKLRPVTRPPQSELLWTASEVA